MSADIQKNLRFKKEAETLTKGEISFWGWEREKTKNTQGPLFLGKKKKKE